jgi:hypothetical protein
MCKRLKPKSTIERGVKLGVFDMSSTLTIGKEAFLRGPAYLVKTDLDAPVSRKKEVCFRDIFPVTHGSVTSPVLGAFMTQVLSVSSWKHWYWILSGGLLGISCM